MWEGGSKYMLGCHYPTEASLVKSIWKGLGFLPSSDFLFFGGEFSQFVKNVLEKESPQILFYFKSPKFAKILPIV